MSEARSVVGQVMRAGARWANRLFRFAFALLVLVALMVGALGLRLAQGPLALPPLAQLLEEAANRRDEPTRLSVGNVVLAWEGIDADQPLELRVRDARLIDTAGRRLADLPGATVSIALRPLLLGRIAVRSITFQGLDVTLLRSGSGRLMLDLGSQGERFDAGTPDAGTPDAGTAGSGNLLLARLLDELAAPDAGPFARRQLRTVRLNHARVSIVDAGLGLTWRVPDLNLALRAGAGVSMEGSATLLLGTETVRVGVAGSWQKVSGQAAAVLSIAELHPALLAAAAPALAPLGLLDASASVDLRLQFGGGLALEQGIALVRLGAGRIASQGMAGIPIAGALLRLEATRQEIRLAEARITLDTAGPGPKPVLTADAALSLGASPRARIAARLPELDVAELPRLWPEGFGGNERSWLVANIPAGKVEGLDFAMEASLPADFSGFVPTSLQIKGNAIDATVHYLRPMPPAEGARGRFQVDLDTADITIDQARVGRGIEGSGTVRLTDLAGRVQAAEIALDLTAPLAEALGLLQHPRLHLFETHPLPQAVREATGTAGVKLGLRLPLLASLAVADVEVDVNGQLGDVRLPRLLAGQDVTAARLQLGVTNAGMQLTGPVRIADSAASVTYQQDFRAGPPNQAIEQLRAEGRAGPALLAGLGIAADGRLAGSPPVNVVMTVRRNGQAEAAIRADLRDARISLPEIGFAKAPGVPGTLEASVRLARERITAVENLRAEAPGLSLRGRLGFAEGRPERLTLSSLSLGRSRLSGEVQFGAEGTLAVTARGPVLDAGWLFAPDTGTAGTPQVEPERRVPGLRLDLGFERVWLANEQSAEGVSLRLDRRAGPQGGRIEQLNLSGRIGQGGAFEATVARRAGGRSLTGRANDAGAFLAATDVITSMAGGRMTLEGTFDDRTEVLSGTAAIADFRMRDAPAIGRLLQGMTLYGLLDMARGPGLTFSQLNAPFTWDNPVLTLSDARAFSPSLGVTVKGRIDTRAHSLDLQGTVVPAYFFNSLLGNIPLIGRLFSPERGGGVFAATYTARGPMADPSVAVNPLAALTPGFLRGLFGIFDTPSQQQGAPPPATGPDAPPG